MLLGTSERLDDVLVRELGIAAVLDARTLRERLAVKGRPVSLVSVYAALNALIEAGVVVKSGCEFSLSVSWIVSLESFSKAAYVRCTGALARVLPAAGKAAQWNFGSIRQLDTFWVQLLLLLLDQSKERVMYEWAPRNWFALVDIERDRAYQQSQRTRGYRVFMQIGGNTFLDQYGTRQWEPEAYSWIFSQRGFERDTNRYYCAIDDYLLTIVIEPRGQQKLDAVFLKAKRLSELNIAGFYRIVDHGCRTRIKLEHNKRRASDIRERIRKAFDGKNRS